LRRRVKLIIGVVVALAVLISGVAYLLVIEWLSRETPPVAPHEIPQSVEIVLLRSGEPTRTDDAGFGGYLYDVRFYDARDNEIGMASASIRREPGLPVQYRLTVDLAHHVETWWLSLDGDPSTTHLEWLSLKFNFTRPIPVNLQDLWLLTPDKYSPSFPGSFSLESWVADSEDLTHRVFVMNFTELRNIERPPSSPAQWSWVPFQFLMTPAYPEPTPPYFEPFTLEISFTLHRVISSGGKVISHYERGTTKPLMFQLPVAASCEPAGTETHTQATAATEHVGRHAFSGSRFSISNLPLSIHFCAWKCI